MIKAVIFDMDGVIVESEDINIKSALESFRELGIELDEDDVRVVIGRLGVDYSTIFREKYEFENNKRLWDRQIELYRKFYDEPRPIKRTIDFISKLQGKGFTLALTTSSLRIIIKPILSKLGLDDVFEVVVTADDILARKPLPDAYLLTAKKLDVDVSDCLVFEDTEIGVRAAKSAGMRCVALPNKYTLRQDFSGADLMFEENEDLDWEDIRGRIED